MRDARKIREVASDNSSRARLGLMAFGILAITVVSYNVGLHVGMARISPVLRLIRIFFIKSFACWMAFGGRKLVQGGLDRE